MERGGRGYKEGGDTRRENEDENEDEGEGEGGRRE